LWAGLNCAAGSAVISMDGDLQHPPSLIPELIHEWRQGAQIVNTIRIDPEGISFFKKFTSSLFYKIFSFLSGVNMKSGMSDFRLLDRVVLNHILNFGEEDLFLRAIVQWIGFKQADVPFQCNPRFSGRSKYNIINMFKFACSGITSFSIIPLRMAILFGLVTSAFSFYQMIEALYAKIVLNSTVPGWATTITLMTFMFGILFILLGIIGEYIGRILIEAKGRPKFLVRELIGVLEHTRSSAIHRH
jgi:dolichol-phosphate mannosyltransferase